MRLSEATPIGTEAFRLLAFPRRNFNIQALDGVRNCFAMFFFSYRIRGHSQTTFTAIRGGGVHEMSTLLNKFGKFH